MGVKRLCVKYLRTATGATGATGCWRRGEPRKSRTAEVKASGQKAPAWPFRLRWSKRLLQSCLLNHLWVNIPVLTMPPCFRQGFGIFNSELSSMYLVGCRKYRLFWGYPTKCWGHIAVRTTKQTKELTTPYMSVEGHDGKSSSGVALSPKA